VTTNLIVCALHSDQEDQKYDDEAALSDIADAAEVLLDACARVQMIQS